MRQMIATGRLAPFIITIKANIPVATKNNTPLRICSLPLNIFDFSIMIPSIVPMKLNIGRTIVTVVAKVPADNAGDIMGDFNKRRGRVMGIEPAEDGSETQVVLAEVPFSEMTDYVIALRASTQGRGRFDFDFIRYDEVPSSIADKVIAEAKREQA